MTPKGVKTILSGRSVRDTSDHLQKIILTAGAIVYARIDQQLELGKVGMTIPPLEFILFGNPTVGGRLIREQPLIALDLPLKAIVWEDKDRNVWLSYNESQYLAARYDLSGDAGMTINLDKLIDNAMNTLQ